MGNYYNKIKHLYPSATDKDFLLNDDSNGTDVYITEWNTGKLGVQPTIAQLDLQVDDATADATALGIESEAKFNEDTVKAIGLTMKDFMNDIMSGRTDPITNSELKTKFKTYL